MKRKRGSFKNRKFIFRKVNKYLFIFILFILLLGLFRVFKCSLWDGKNNLNLAIGGGSDVYILSINPGSGEITRIYVPGNTEIELSRNMGLMKAKNIWKRGFDEGLKGDLLSQSLTKNMKISVYAWGGKEINAFWDGGLGDKINVIFGSVNTNLSFGDKVRIVIFTFGVKDFKKSEIDLSKSQFLLKTKLGDGEEGYLISGKLSKALSMISSDQRLSNASLRLKITDHTGNKSVSESLGKIIEALGAKVALIEEGEENNSDCVLKTTNKDAGLFLTKTFQCDFKNIKSDGNFDMEIEVGRSFSERF